MEKVKFNYFGFRYEVINDETKEVSLCSARYDGKIIIPREVEYNGQYYKVTNIRSELIVYQQSILPTDRRKKREWKEIKTAWCSPFSKSWQKIDPEKGEFLLSDITDIVMPDTIATLGNCAFHCCVNLKYVKIPPQVTIIPIECFAQCKSLENVEFHNNITKIESGAFAGCSSLKEITIPSSVKTIGAAAFVETKYLESGLEVVNIMNDEGNIIIHPNAFPRNAVVNYLGLPKEQVSVTEAPTDNAGTGNTASQPEVIDLDKLMAAALADGVLTDKERQVLIKKVKAAGVDVDEFEILLDAKLYELQSQTVKKVAVVNEPVKPIADETASGQRNYDKYSVNGSGKYGKGRMVEAVILKYMELNPSVSVNLLKEIFPDHLQGGMGIIRAASDNIRDPKRWYKQSLPSGEEFYICNQWGTQTDGFMEYVNANVKGIKVNKI